MSTERVDFLFRGAHPAFYWAAALLKQKGKTVAVLPEPSVHSWELFPRETLDLLGLQTLKTDRDQDPIQILTRSSRFGIFNDVEFTKKDFAFCSGGLPVPEIHRGLSFYAKGSDYPAVFGESSNELIEDCHQMEYFEKPPEEVHLQILKQLKTMGVILLKDPHELPIAEQSIILDCSRAKVFRTKFEISIPLKEMPVGSSNRMLFVERNSPLIEMRFRENHLHLRTLLPEEPLLIEKMLMAVSPYLLEKIDPTIIKTMVKIIPRNTSHEEWGELKTHVDSSKLGVWCVSPALNPELGERSLYVRLSELLVKKFKKQQVFENTELFLT